MLKTITSPLVAGLLLSGFSVTAIAQDANKMPPLTTVTYVCERKVVVPVVYINELPDHQSAAVIHVEGKQVPMRIWPGADGARYIALDEQDSYRWHTKGDEAVLSYLEADHMAKEQFLLRDCVKKSESRQQN